MSEFHEVPVFENLSRDQIAEMTSWLTRQRYKPGETLIVEGGAPDGFHILLEGRVEVLQTIMESGRRVAVLEPPAVVGEIGLITHHPRSATVMAIEETLSGFLARETYERKIAEDNIVALRIGYNLGRIGCDRYSQAVREMREFVEGEMRKVKYAIARAYWPG
ncbi:Acetyltransferase Pat [Planctomycetes bacterium Pan216]|uniref:Acetyltransferase Pat n=1 Tax=Kolteria novifilia TaxID=2527975 RepID=A0A518B6K0_9BACT|nr:Acetyltransferase Pat [Planctomycetes bacterium Pan216]